MALACPTLMSQLIRDFLTDNALCDAAEARHLASKLDAELRRCDLIETEDGTTFVRAPRENRRLAGGHARQLGF